MVFSVTGEEDDDLDEPTWTPASAASGASANGVGGAEVQAAEPEPPPAPSRASASRPPPTVATSRKRFNARTLGMPLPAYVPKEGLEGWRDVVATERAEAEASNGPGRGVLLSAAARISLRKLGDSAEAERLLMAALAAGDPSPDSRRVLAEIRGAVGKYGEQEQAWLDLARMTSGADRSEAFLEAALIAWRRRDRPAEAVTHLREAAKALPEDYTSRALLRTLIPAVAGGAGATLAERVELLEELAGLAEGGIASDARVEQAALAEEARRPDLARRAYEQALEAEPGHTIAFQRLEKALGEDPAALAQLYAREAARPDQTTPGWWQVKAARAWLAAGRASLAAEAFGAAVDAGYTFAMRELQGHYLGGGSEGMDDLEVMLAREVESLTPGAGRAHAAFRLGWIRERHLNDPRGALEAYLDAVKTDVTAAPASDAAIRLLADAERATFLDERIRTTPDEDERRALQLLAAELSESRGDEATARRWFEEIVRVGAPGQPEVELARDGLDRVLQRTNDVQALSQLRRARAESATDMNDRVSWLLLAGSVPADRSLALPMWSSALDTRPDHPVALAAVVVALELEVRYQELITRLVAAGDASPDPARKAAYLLRASWVMAEHGNDPAAALAIVERALQAEPRLRGARWLARRLRPLTAEAAEAQSNREQAGFASSPAARSWALFAAAVISGKGATARNDVATILAEQAEHPGATALLEVLLVADRDLTGLVALYRKSLEGATGAAGARIATRCAELLIDTGRADEAAAVLRRIKGVEDAPLRAGARLALQIGSAERAIELLSGSDAEEDKVERARLLGASGRAAEALPLLMELVGTATDRVGVAARAATVAQQLNDPDATIRGYAVIAQKAKSDSLRAAYGAWTAMHLQSVGRDGDALEYWQIARKHRPASTQALLGVLRGLVARKERTKIRPLFADVRPELTPIEADALIELGDVEGATEVLWTYALSLGEQSALPERQLTILLEVERLLINVADWPGAYEALILRRELCNAKPVQAMAESAVRWVLAEKLTETDAAWQLYRELHDETPEDRTVTDALARIASARGEVGMAIGYLEELANSAPTPQEAAALRRRIGEVHESTGQNDSARQAYLDALDHVRDDRDALEGLRRLATQAKDWPGLVAVLLREAAYAERSRKIELLRQSARVTEDRIGDRAVAIDRWRALLELDPANREGLEHVLALAEGQGEWALFVEAGEALASQLSGREQATLLRQVGVACQDRLGRDDAGKYYEQAVAVPPPDHEAASRLEGLARARADWAAVVRALRLQAAADVDDTLKVGALLKAATVELESQHDKEAAAKTYRQVLDLRPDELTALKFMAGHLFDNKRFEEALPLCERLEPFLGDEDDSDDFDSKLDLASFYFYFGEMLRSRGDDLTAIPRYEKALALNPAHLPSLESVAPLYAANKQWDKAERAYRQLLQLTGGQGEKGKVATQYTSLGMVERALGQGDKAYKRFTKALELHPNHVGALKGTALILEDRQDWSNLLNVYNNVIYHAAVPEDVIDAYMTKGRILDSEMQRPDKAAQHYQRSLDFDANQPQAHLRLGEIAMRREGYKDAGDIAERALQLDADVIEPYRALFLVMRGAAWQAAGHAPEAERCLREAKLLDPSLVAQLGESPLGDLAATARVVRANLTKSV